MEKISVIFCLAAVIGLLIGVLLAAGAVMMVIKGHNQCTKKVIKYYFILNEWLALRQKNETVVKFFEKNNYKTVAIYGLKELGERLIEELEGSGITVVCVVDQNRIKMVKNIQVLSPTDKIPDVDVMVVTASFYFNQIKAKMKDKVSGDIVSIDDVIYSKY